MSAKALPCRGMAGGRAARHARLDHQGRWQNGQASALVEPTLLVTVTITLIVKLPNVPHTFEHVGPVQLLLKPPDHAYVTGVEEVALTLQKPPPVPEQVKLLITGGDGGGTAAVTAASAFTIPVPMGWSGVTGNGRTLFRRCVSICAGVSRDCPAASRRLCTSAATPATCGAAIDVPP